MNSTAQGAQGAAKTARARKRPVGQNAAAGQHGGGAAEAAMWTVESVFAEISADASMGSSVESAGSPVANTDGGNHADALIAVGALANAAASTPEEIAASGTVGITASTAVRAEMPGEREAMKSEATFKKAPTGFAVESVASSIVKDATRSAARYAAGCVTAVCTVGNAALGWLRTQHVQRTSGRRLRVIETVSLGEKRFAALLAVDGAEFLIGGSGSSVALLASVDNDPGSGFRHALQQATAGPAQ